MFADRVMETSTTTGTGDITLAGAVNGFRTFNAACGTGDTFDYAIFAIDADTGAPTGAWEVGVGTYAGSNVLQRTTVLASSNAGAAVSFAAGTKHVILTVSARRFGGSETTSITTTTADLLTSNAGKYHRFTNTSAKTLTVRPNATHAIAQDAEFHLRNVGAADLTIVAGSGVTVNPPNGGTLVVPEGGTVTIKRVAEDVFDLLGQTVAA